MRVTIVPSIAAALFLAVVAPRAAAQAPSEDAGGAPDSGAATPDGGAMDADGGVTGTDGGVTNTEGGVPMPPPPPDPFAGKPLEAGADRQTGIRGRIVDRKTGVPMVKVPVLARGSDEKTRAALTDDQGAFQFFVPPGSYTVRSYFNLYHGVRMEKVPVKRGNFASIRLVLEPIDIMQDIAVVEIEIPYRADTTTIAAQDQLRKEARGIGEGMGAQQMSQQGAGDAAAAARRVVGVTIESNQLVIRGLGGRYVRVFLNGLPLPNTDPDFPSVDLDLFPTNVIDNLNIQKVFLPEIPADFAGGVLDINTVSFPRKLLVSASIGTAYNSQTTFKNNLSYRGGGTDWLALDDGTRALPDAVRRVKLAPATAGGGGLPSAQLEALGETFQNRWNTRTTAGLPQMGFNLTLGNSINFAKKRRFGFLTSLVYDYALERVVGVSRPKPGITDTGQLTAANIYDVESGNESVQLSAIGTASLDLGLDHSLTALSLFNRSMDDQTRYRIGTNADLPDGPYDNWQLRFLARTIFVNQVLGDHRNLGGTRLRLRWSAFHAIGRRDEPDQRVIKYGFTSGSERRWIPTADRLWSELSQTDIGATTQLRFPLWPEAWGTIGGRVGNSDRDFSNRRFVYQMGGTPTDYTVDPETLFGPANIGPSIRVLDFTKPNDSYTASQQNFATFLMLETPIVGALSASGGARLEVFSQQVQSMSPFPEDNTPEKLAMSRTDRSDTNVLPGAALKYAVSETMLFRAAYGKTLSRPQVRELAPYDYYDFLRDRMIIGNPELKTATIHNADVRWEWFFGEGQVAAVSGFYKRFIDPIELQIIDAQTQNSQYQNAKGATSFGTELELRTELGKLAQALRRFSLGGNLSLIRSRIEVAESGATRTTRALAGQAPYVINLSLRFAVPETKLSLGFVYNVVGPRITDVGVRAGTQILPDVEEQAFHSLDFVGSWGFVKHFSLKLRARNLLFQNRVIKQGPIVAQELRPGITVSAGLAYEY
jgi:outer membrane receptor protein involved in Fe transport